jgi:two-component system sensor histidine kinase DegS
MRQSALLFQRPAEILISSVFLVLNLLFTFAYFFVTPYSGFYFNPSDGTILTIFVEAESSAALQEGDVIGEIGGISWAKYAVNGKVIFFENAQPGEVVNVKVLRNDAELNVPWVFPGFNPAEFKNRFFNLWWLGYFFWAFGMLTQLFIRPRDTRWRLLSISSYLTGFWVVLGTTSASQVWGSSLLLHAVTWLMTPIYLHLHWVFPKPFSERSNWVWVALYLAGFALAAAELLHAISRLLYGLGFFLALVGSVILLVTHAVRQPAQRKDVALLAIALAIATFPSIILAVAGLTNAIPQIGPLALVFLPIIPGTYFFIVYRRQLGGLEARANRVFSIYLYLSLLGALILFLIGVSVLSPASQGALISFGALLTLLTALISVLGFPAFQRFVDQRLLGIKLPYQNLLETYSARIATSVSTQSLLQLLDEDVFPSLLVKQYAFVQFADDAPRVILVRGVEADQLPNLDDAPALTSLAGRFLLPEERRVPSWIRLILTLRAGEETLGLFLLGRRDPDDLYHADELPIFQSLADQTAIAMSNLLQEERLRSLYQSDIQRREQERLSLARELHDSILNQLAALRMNLGDTTPSPRFEQAYAEVVQRLREIVSDLRPPMLNYGLKLALEEFTQTLMERSENRLRVTLALLGEDQRYPPNVELHLFRIVQESCENAMHHAKATNIVITAQMDVQMASIEIKDDGVGFEMGERMDLNELLAHKHFGLAGIVERANLIKADASIQSAPAIGTRVRVSWRAPRNGQE